MKNFLTIVVVIVVLFVLGSIPVWSKPVKTGTIKVNTFTKIQLMLGLIKID